MARVITMGTTLRELGSSSRWIYLFALFALPSCKGHGDEANATTAMRGPLSLTWEQPYKLVVVGTGSEAMFFPTKETTNPPLELRASFSHFPKGTKVKIGTETGSLGDGSFWSTMVDIKSRVLRQSPDDLKGPVELDLDLSVEAPGAPPATTNLPKQDVKGSVRFALLKARDGGISFDADDSEAVGKPRGAAVISGLEDIDFVGHAKTVEELDWVFIAEDQKEPRATKSCQFKEGPSTLKMFDASVVAYERRTGEKRAERVLKASDECPMFAYVSKDDNSAKSTVASAEVVSFARAELSKAK